MDKAKLDDDRYVAKPNFDGFVVIGAGLPRTGTASMRSALSILLKGPIYHMFEVLKGGQPEVEFWNAAGRGKKTNEEWKQFFEGRGFRAGVDFPPSLFYEKLMEIFPDAKVVMTVRDNPEKWYDSVHGTIYQINLAANSFPLNILTKLDGSAAFHDMAGNLMKDGVPDGLFEAISQGKEASVKYYNNWVEEVKKNVPSDKLLTFSVKEGWEPLCKFLDLPVPDGPFPNTNDTKMMQQRLRVGKTIAYLLVFGVPILIGIIMYFFLF